MNALRIAVTTPTTHTLPPNASAFLALMAMKPQEVRIQTVPVAVGKYDDEVPKTATRQAVRSIDRDSGFVI